MGRIRSASQAGMSLIAMLVIVVIVGGIASAFFLLSQIEARVAEGARVRTKAYYLGEAAIEQVAAMIKQATTNHTVGSSIPPNPADANSPGAPMSGTGTVNGLTWQFVFQYYDTNKAQWVPQWDFKNSRWAYYDTASNQLLPMAPGTAANALGDPANLHLYMAGQLSILLEPHSLIPGVDALNSETFTYTATKFQELSGVGVGNTGKQAYYNITAQARVKHYDVSGSNAANKGSNVYLTRELQVANNSLLPFFAFFDGDLEFLPGPAFVGNGKIHTNNNLFIGGGTSIDMNSDYIGAHKQMYRHRLNDGSYTENPGPLTIHGMLPGTPTPGALGPGSASWAESLESMTPTGKNPNWTSGLQAAGLSPTVQQGANEMKPPPIGSIQPPPSSGGPGGDYYTWAKNTSTANGVATGLIISVDTGGNVQALYNNGTGQTDVTAALTTQGAISSSQIADNRQSQSKYVQTTVVDMKKLQSSGYFPSNGVLYTTDARNGSSIPSTDPSGNPILLPPSPPPSVPSGFVFNNGAAISAPVNIVSNGPVYVQGDFNIPTTDPNTGAVLSTKQPAAVIADAVNLLSNGWNNSKTPGGGVPNATETTYNFAMITGQVPTQPGVQYSGGLENLPRFHENWGGVNCNYRGSLISLWTSAIATGVWGQNNVYSPPKRNWDWDSAFATQVGSAVPGFPRAISISRTIYSMDYWGAGGSSSYRAAQ